MQRNSRRYISIVPFQGSLQIDDGSESTVGQNGRYNGDFNEEKEHPDGHGKMTWDNGVSYEGDWENGVYNGFGSKLYSRGGGYVGHWENGIRKGEGTHLFAGKFGYERFQGNFVDDQPHGEGTMTYMDGTQTPFLFNMGKPISKSKNIQYNGNDSWQIVSCATERCSSGTLMKCAEGDSLERESWDWLCKTCLEDGKVVEEETDIYKITKIRQMIRKPTLTQEQVLEFKTAFELMDKESVGSINAKELHELLESLEQMVTEEEVLGFNATNKSGKIELETFLVLMRQILYSDVEDVEEEEEEEKKKDFRDHINKNEDDNDDTYDLDDDDDDDDKNFVSGAAVLKDVAPSTIGSQGIYKGDWNGTQPDGYGVMTWKNGIEYKGMWKNGQFHGHGRKLYPNYGGYEGDWVHGKREGSGLLFFDSNTDFGKTLSLLRWEGSFVNDQAHGIGQSYIAAEAMEEDDRWAGDTAVKGKEIVYKDGEIIKIGSVSMVTTARIEGRVRWFDKKKGFGFIYDFDESAYYCDIDEGFQRDVFVHWKDIKGPPDGSGYLTLCADTIVEFSIGVTAGKQCAVNVTGPNYKILVPEKRHSEIEEEKRLEEKRNRDLYGAEYEEEEEEEEYEEQGEEDREREYDDYRGEEDYSRTPWDR